MHLSQKTNNLYFTLKTLTLKNVQVLYFILMSIGILDEVLEAYIYYEMHFEPKIWNHDTLTVSVILLCRSGQFTKVCYLRKKIKLKLLRQYVIENTTYPYKNKNL